MWHQIKYFNKPIEFQLFELVLNELDEIWFSFGSSAVILRQNQIGHCSVEILKVSGHVVNAALQTPEVGHDQIKLEHYQKIGNSPIGVKENIIVSTIKEVFKNVMNTDWLGQKPKPKKTGYTISKTFLTDGSQYFKLIDKEVSYDCQFCKFTIKMFLER